MKNKKNSVLDNLENSSRKELINCLTKMQIPFNFTSNNSELAKLISSHLNDISFSTSSQPFIKINNICYKLFYISILCALSLSCILMIIYLWPRQNKFCDSSLHNSTVNYKCTRCPPFAKCTGGSCICDLNYTRIKNYCIFNDADKNHVSTMVENAHDILKKRGGSYYCKKSKIDWMSIDELEGILLKYSKLNISSFSRIFKKTLLHLNQDPNLLTYKINGNTVIVSKDITICLDCKIKQYLYTKINYFCGISFLLILFTIIYTIHRNSQKKKQIANRYSAFLIGRLKQKKGIQQSRNQLIYSLDSVSDNNGARIWPYVEKQLKKSGNIQHLNDGYNSSFRYVDDETVRNLTVCSIFK